jgi:hypothetical protein
MPVVSRYAYFSRRHSIWLAIVLMAGCGSAGNEHGDARAAAYAAYNEATAAFKSKDYAAAEPKLASALESRLLNPDVFCEATVLRSVCLASTGKYDEATAALDSLGPGASNIDQIFAARSYILAKQGKLAESRAALAKARQANRTVAEFKD